MLGVAAAPVGLLAAALESHDAAATPLASACPSKALDNTSLVVYNRIPKCGSTTMIKVLQHMSHQAGRNFRAVNVPGHLYYMADPFIPGTEWSEGWDALRAAALGEWDKGPGGNWSKKTDQSSAPRTIFINHMFWPDLAMAPGGALPAAHNIQMMREPVTREISGYYYLMYGPRPAAKMAATVKARRRLTGLDHAPTINEFMHYAEDRWGRECWPYTPARGHIKGNMQTRFFCGFHPVCEDICSEAALHRAKSVLTNQYLVVGLLEHLESSIALLERLLPGWLSGLGTEYGAFVDELGGHGARTHNGTHEPPSAATTGFIQSIHRQDIALYTHATNVLEEKLKVCLPGKTFEPIATQT